MIRPLTPGTVLQDRYKIIEQIGQGGMGAVYRAEDLRLPGRECAIKEVFLEPGASPVALAQLREQFYREARVLARLDHPNLPKVSDYFTASGREYLVMDFVPGQDLKTLLEEVRRQGRFLPERDVLAWARQLCDALEYLHGQDPPVLHRDIKPANIKLTPAGTVKLVDFGLVKLLITDEERTITLLPGRGTLQYTPLEQYGGDTGEVDVRSDIYSLGATLYHLLTGEPPADAKTRFLRPDSLIPPRQLNPSLSPQTERVILWAMAMHPAERPSSIAEFRAALLAGFPPTAPAPLAPSWKEAVKANGFLLFVAIGMTLLALLLTLLSR